VILLDTNHVSILFDSLRAAKVRIATRDLKIAAISLASNAVLLTAIGDFGYAGRRTKRAFTRCLFFLN
jgi:hypothetical protein